MMTRKHFEALAAALKAEKPGDNWDPNKRVQWDLDVKAIANAVASFNPNFDRDRFLKAAGIERLEYASAGATRKQGWTPERGKAQSDRLAEERKASMAKYFDHMLPSLPKVEKK
jgi:hypothetical protein